MNQTIRVGNAQAFWGDRPSAAKELLSQEPDLDFLTMDYLAEVSMSILASQRDRDPNLGYPRDFVEVVQSLVDYWAAGGRCKLIANAGGLNPMACARACMEAIERAGCRSLRIGVVSGDDVLEILKRSDDDAHSNLDTDEAITTIQGRLVTANAYMGCEGIAAALDQGADIVITGRVADPSMVVGACMHAFGWKFDDWNRLAGATVAGHLLECGTHASGGISTDWLNVPDIANVGFPIAEIRSDGSCVITKSERAGGCVTIDTVREQLVYEIGDPEHYISPDVCVSFTKLSVVEQSPNRIEVSGAVGSERPQKLKVSATFRDGFRAAGTLTIVGKDAYAKARKTGAIVLKRLTDAGHKLRDSIVECLGAGASVPVACGFDQTSLTEIVLRIAVESESRQAVEQFTREMIPLVTAGPQGTTGYAEGRPKVHHVFRYWPTLIESTRVQQLVQLLESHDTAAQRTKTALWLPYHSSPMPDYPNRAAQQNHRNSPASGDSIGSTLFDFAIARSGDKGIGANIGVIARSEEQYPWLVEWLTAERVAEYFAAIGVDSVERFLLPNLHGMNFLVRGILRRGIRNDAQGKALGQALLLMPIKNK